MRQAIARVFLFLSILIFITSAIFTFNKTDPFYTFFFLFAWWSYIIGLDSWLFLKGGDSIFLEKPGQFIGFLVPLSTLLWFNFEAFNLRLDNWTYVHLPKEMWLRWLGYFLSFGTVLPGIFLTANLLERFRIFPKNEFSLFFSEEIPFKLSVTLQSLGSLMLILPLIWPKIFFPLIWGGFVLLLDPWVAKWKGKSLIQEWRQGNFARTSQLLLAGFICGGLWEFWNSFAGAKWIYTVPLPQALLGHIKIFEMPALGFLGFPPFALECFVITEFVRSVQSKTSISTWKTIMIIAFFLSLAMCRGIDLHTVSSLR